MNFSYSSGGEKKRGGFMRENEFRSLAVRRGKVMSRGKVQFCNVSQEPTGSSGGGVCP